MITKMARVCHLLPTALVPALNQALDEGVPALAFPDGAPTLPSPSANASSSEGHNSLISYLDIQRHMAKRHSDKADSQRQLQDE